MFSANKVVNIIKDDINANFHPGINFTTYNFFGMRADEIENKFTQPNCVIIIYNGCSYETETSSTMRGLIDIEFVIVEQTIAVSEAEEVFLIDKFRDFITWQVFDELAEEYPTDDFEPFMPTDEALYTTLDSGVSLFTFRGNIRFVKRNIGG